jgi:hypothetical protein
VFNGPRSRGSKREASTTYLSVGVFGSPIIVGVPGRADMQMLKDRGDDTALR